MNTILQSAFFLLTNQYNPGIFKCQSIQMCFIHFDNYRGVHHITVS